MATNKEFDFKLFKVEYDTNRMLTIFGNLLSNPAIVANVPAEVNAQIREELRLDDQPQQHPEFDFELGDVITLDEAVRRCENRTVEGAPAPVNVMDMTRTHINRVYFNTAMIVANPVWVEVSRPEAADFSAEVAEIVCYDKAKTLPNWQNSLPRLKELAQARKYNAHMMASSLNRLVIRYQPDLTRMIEGLECNDIANFLLNQERNKDSRAFRRKELYQVSRTPDQDLKAPIARAQTIIDQLYPADQPELAAYRSSAIRTAVMSFLPDQLAGPLAEELKRATELCRLIPDDRLMDLAQKMEDASRVRPLFELKYGRLINSIPATEYIQFNSMENRNVTGLPTTFEYGLPYQPNRNPYSTYQPFIPNEDMMLGPPYAAMQQAPVFQPPAALGVQPQQQMQQMQQMQIQMQMQQQQQMHQHQAARLQQAEQLALANQQQAYMAEQMPAQLAAGPGSGSNGSEDAETISQTLQPNPALAGAASTAALSASRALLTRLAKQKQEQQRIGSGQTSAGSIPVYSDKKIRGGQNRSVVSDTAIRTRSRSGGNASANPVIEFDSMSFEDLSKEQIVELLSITLDRQKETIKESQPKTDSYKRGEVRNDRYSSRSTDRDRNRPKEGSVSFSRDRNSDQDRRSGRDRSRDNSRSRDSDRSRPSDYRSDRFRSRDRTDRVQSRERESRTYLQPRRQESQSPRRENSSNLPRGRRQRSASGDRFRDRNNSVSMRQTYPEMKKGINCRSEYAPDRMKNCSKCPKSGHHEFSCPSYDRWAPRVCDRCGKFYHFSDQCAEPELFPPKHNEQDRKNE